jgi:hypothetical protein
MEQSTLLEKLLVTQGVNIFLPSMKLEGTLQLSKESGTGLYPEPHESNPDFLIMLF